MVYKGEYRRTPDSKGMEVAIKTIKANQATDDFIKEMKVMSRLIHPNIVRFYGLIHRQGIYITHSYSCVDIALLPDINGYCSYARILFVCYHGTSVFCMCRHIIL